MMGALASATSGPRQYAAKRDLIREGDRPGPVFVILEGWACRYKVLPGGIRQVLAFLLPDDCCDLHIGPLAEMDHSIQTITEALVAMIDRVEMNAITDNHRAVAKAMYIAQLVDEGTCAPGLPAWDGGRALSASLTSCASYTSELATLGWRPTRTLPCPRRNFCSRMRSA
jgi:hypothetical protein